MWLPRTWIQGSAALRRARVRPIPRLAAVLAVLVGGLMLASVTDARADVDVPLDTAFVKLTDRSPGPNPYTCAGDHECINVDVICGGLTRNVTVRMHDPDPAASSGAVWFATGETASTFYRGSNDVGERRFASDQLDDVFAANLKTFEYQFEDPQGVFTGVSENRAGYVNAFCPLAHLIQWADANFLEPSEKICAVGSSGGGGQIAYGLADNGLDAYLASAVIISGPPMSRTDIACAGPLSPAPNPGGVCQSCIGSACGADEMCRAISAITSREQADIMLGFGPLSGYVDTEGHEVGLGKCYNGGHAANVDNRACVPDDLPGCIGFWDDVLELSSIAWPASFDYDYPNTALHFLWSRDDPTGANYNGTYLYAKLSAPLKTYWWAPDNLASTTIDEGALHQIYQTIDGYEYVTRHILRDCVPDGTRVLHADGSGFPNYDCNIVPTDPAGPPSAGLGVLIGASCALGSFLENPAVEFPVSGTHEFTLRLRNAASSGGPAMVDLYVDNEYSGTFSSASSAFTNDTIALSVDAGPHAIRLVGAGSGPIVEHLILVPEPCQLVMLVTGTSFLGLLYRRHASGRRAAATNPVHNT